MTKPLFHETPRLRTVLREQVRAVAFVLRTPGLIAATLLTIATVVNVFYYVNGQGGVDFDPELSMIPGFLGVAFPLGIWKRQERIGGGFFWGLPVDRRHHALLKVCAGWICLSAVVTVFTFWLFALAACTGGKFLSSQELLLLPSMEVPPNGTISRGDLHSVSWTPSALLWLVPFTASTCTYLLASAFALGSRYPLRWIIGAFLGALLLLITGTAAQAEWLKLAPLRLLSIAYEGRWGLDALFTAKTESLKTAITLTDGTTQSVWRGLPVLKDWVIATLLWFGTGLISLWAAASRHRERN